MRYLLFALLAALTALPALAGVPAIPRFRIVGAAEGLPSTMITAIAQDRAGYLWMTTTDGLVRYDGAEFKVWRNDPADRYSLRSNILQALYIDSQDRIWLALGGAGVAMLSADRSKLTAYLPDDVPELALGDVYAIAGRGDDVWFGLSTGNVLRLDAAGQFTSFDLSKMEQPLPASPVYALALDDRDRMWIGTLGGLAYYDGLALHRVRPDGDDSGITALQWVGQWLWASMDTGLRYMDASGAWHTPSWAPMFAAGNRAWAVADAGDGEFWLGTEQGLWHTRPDHPPTPVNNGDAPLVSNRHVTTIWRSPHGGSGYPCMGAGWPTCAKTGAELPPSNRSTTRARASHAALRQPIDLAGFGSSTAVGGCCVTTRLTEHSYRLVSSIPTCAICRLQRPWRTVGESSGWAMRSTTCRVWTSKRALLSTSAVTGHPRQLSGWANLATARCGLLTSR